MQLTLQEFHELAKVLYAPLTEICVADEPCEVKQSAEELSEIDSLQKQLAAKTWELHLVDDALNVDALYFITDRVQKILHALSMAKHAEQFERSNTENRLRQAEKRIAEMEAQQVPATGDAQA